MSKDFIRVLVLFILHAAGFVGFMMWFSHEPSPLTALYASIMIVIAGAYVEILADHAEIDAWEAARRTA